MPLLGVNIDHVATLRQARYRSKDGGGDGSHGEPDPARAVGEAELGGADIITIHLREDRRHIQDRDARLIRELARVRVNLEMAATVEMVRLARELKPHMVTLVPEGRQEVTTEGGLDVRGQMARLKDMVSRLKAGAAAEGGMTVSAFIDPDAAQVQAAKEAGFTACELHTGPFAEAFAAAGGDAALGGLGASIQTLADAAHRVRAVGMRLHAGHALNYANVRHVAGLPGMSELHIGHAIVARAVFVGLREAVREMKVLCGA